MFKEAFLYFSNLPLWELLAVVLSVIYVVLAAKNNPWCWPAAFVSTLIFSVIFYDVQLLMDSLLQVYYLVMAIYGWYCWQNASFRSLDGNLSINSWSTTRHIKAIVILSFTSVAVGYLVDNYTQADFPYLDSLTTVFAIFSTYLVAKKVLENWLYWIVIDFVSIYLYISKDLKPTAVLFILYVLIAAIGYWQWRKQYSVEQNAHLALANS